MNIQDSSSEHLIDQSVKDDSPQGLEESNFLYTDITPLIELINRKEDQIQNSELAYFMEASLDPKEAVNRVEQLQRAELERIRNDPKKIQELRQNGTPTFYIFRSMLIGKFLEIGLLNFMSKGVGIGSVYMLDLVTDSIKEYDPNDRSTIGKPIGYLLLMTFIYLLGTIIDSKSQNADNQFIAKMKVIGQYLIYQKALKTKYLQETIQKKRKVEGDDKEQKKDGDEEHVANVNNLLTVDIDEMMGVRWGLFEFIGSLTTIAVVIYFLYVKIGNAMIKGLIFFGIAIVVNGVISSLTIYFYRQALVHKDNRISLTTDVIDGMKQIKYLSWEDTFNNKILALRKKEFTMITFQKSVDTLNHVYWSSISYILLYIFLSDFLADGNTLFDTNIFTIIALFNLLTMPMGVLPYCISQLINMKVSYTRIKKFLDIDEINQDDVMRLPNQQDQQYAIEIPQISFRWPVKKQEEQEKKPEKVQVADTEQEQVYIFQLNIPELKIKRNTLNMIVGRIGSGKSALLNAILNEMDQFEYNVDTQNTMIKIKEFQVNNQFSKTIIRGSLAYVSQNHWLQNMTIRENILFGKPFDEQLYLRCISACDLAQDFHTFPKKDQFVLGPDAKNISGGQKQRISLARALYQDCDIYLMDDIFSSLDMHVADTVYQRGIKQQLLERGKTVLMVTSQFRFIEMSDKCEVIYVEDGSIITDEKKIQDFLSQEKEKEKKKEQEEDLKRKNSDKVQDFPDDLILAKRQISENTQLILEKDDNVKKPEDEEEERQIGEIAFDTLFYWLSQMSWPIFISFFILTIVVILMRNFIDFWLRAQITPGSDQFDFLKSWFGDSFESQFAYLIGLNVLITILQCGLMTVCTLLSGWRIYRKLNEVIMNSRMVFFDKNGQGRIINRLSNDTLIVDDELPWFAGIFLNSLLSCIGYPLGLIILFPWMIVIIILEMYFFWIVQKKFRKSNRDLKRIQSTNDGKIISHLTESTSGLRVIRSFEKERYFISEYIRKSKEAICSFTNSNKIGYWLSVRLQMLSNLIFLTVSVSIIVLMAIGSSLDYSTCAMTLTYAVLIANIFNGTMMWFTGCESKMVSVERIKQYHLNPQEELVKPVKISQNQRKRVLSEVRPKPFPIRLEDLDNYSIIFSDVTLTYDDLDDETKQVKYALKNFSLKVKKGEKIAFVGRTGSGKTSLLNILFRLYDFQQGQILVNGKNIQNLPLHEVRNMMSVVPQFGFLYNATLRENIDPQNKLTDQQIEQAFNSTGFRIRGMMEQNQQSQNTEKSEQQIDVQNDTNIQFMIAKSGSNLSNGEKQVINFMRIILQDKQIVCLDEATSNMDPKTDEELHKTLFNFAQDRTLLVITHRLENVQKYDRIVVLDKGEIAEIGSYEELTSIKDGKFLNLLNQDKKIDLKVYQQDQL